jgi:hypothetical protein
MTDISAEELIQRLKRESLQSTNWGYIRGIEKAMHIVVDLTKGKNP